ncbi:hypothetical protein [Rhizobium sp. NFR03]|uniref:hypothetical protein n=1 Tax=Rhizobium sp. NFR03 TaxID=1566263 RepID=UPI001114705D|nr:hypothetical protein [Rhizobium sp. NFR03]
MAQGEYPQFAVRFPWKLPFGRVESCQKPGGQGAPNRDGLTAPTPFNVSRLCNLGVEAASDRRVCLLCLVKNNNVAIRPDWLLAILRDVEAFGAKLLHPSDHVQHACIAGGTRMVLRPCLHM